MPLIDLSTYKGPPSYYLNEHFETVIPSLFRKITGVHYTRERIPTPDVDFLDLDWSLAPADSEMLLVVSHGLEGSSDRHYARGLAKLFNLHGVDVLVWNNRSCSGEMNICPVLYHHGCSHDLKTVIHHILSKAAYREIYLSGISMGGAQTLKYLGEEGEDLPSEIRGAVVYSVPCNLPSSAATLKFRSNSFYKNRFLKKLKTKIAQKATQFPDLVDLDVLSRINDFDTFDTHFTARLHGFKDASDFYSSVSADQWMPRIPVPTLIVNAKNDPLLGDACYPVKLAESHPMIHLEIPKRGGHTGFTQYGDEFTWVERRVLKFIFQQTSLKPSH